MAQPGKGAPRRVQAGLSPLGTAYLAPAPFGLELLIGLAAIYDGPKVRDLPIVANLAFGSAHRVPPLGAALTASLGVANIALSGLEPLLSETKIFTFRDIEAQRRQPHGSLSKVRRLPRPLRRRRNSLLASLATANETRFL